MRFVAAAVVLTGSHLAAAQPNPPAATAQPPTSPPWSAPQPPPLPPPAAGTPSPSWGSPPPAAPPPAWGYSPSPPVIGYMPAEMPYEKNDPIPYGYHLERRMRTGLAIAGGAMFGAGYLAAAVGGAVGLSDGSSDFNLPLLFIPIAGPFITTFTSKASYGLGGVPIVEGLLVLDGLLQTGGAITLTVGLAARKQVLVRGPAPAADTTPHIRIGANRIAIEGRF